MRRANPHLLMLSLSWLAGGCTSRHDRTVTFYWNFRDASSQLAGNFTNDNPGCDLAGVDTVEIAIGGTTYSSPCVSSNGSPGLVAGGLAARSYPFSAQALRNGEVVFSATGVADASGQLDSLVDVTLDALNPQSFVVFYNVAATAGTTSATCVFNGVPISGIIYRLEDGSGNPISTTEIVFPGGAPGQQPVACDPASFGFVIPDLPLGSYRFRYLSAIRADGAAVVQVCGYNVFHGGFPVVVPLTTAVGTCL